jgi:hypothetical protein
LGYCRLDCHDVLAGVKADRKGGATMSQKGDEENSSFGAGRNNYDAARGRETADPAALEAADGHDVARHDPSVSEEPLAARIRRRREGD